MSVMASQITSITIVYSTVYLSGADQRKHQSSSYVIAIDWNYTKISCPYPERYISHKGEISLAYRYEITSASMLKTFPGLTSWNKM